MLLFTVPPVDHTKPGHAQGCAVFIDGDGVRDGIRAAAVGIKVNKRPDVPFLAEPISGIVVMCGVQADIPDRDVRVKSPEFPEGDNGAYAVMPPGVQETDMQRQIDTVLCIVGAEHVKGVAEIKDFFITVPSPVCIGVREMTFAGTMADAVFHTVTDFMPVRGSMGMDAGAVTGKRKAILGDEAVCEGREDGGKAEKVLEPFLIMEREILMFQGVSSQPVRNAGMPVGKLFPFAGLFRRLSIFMFGEKIFPAAAPGFSGLGPEPVHQVKIRTRRREGVGVTADQDSSQAVGFQFPEPGGQAGEAGHYHKDKGADDLDLVFGRPANRGIKSGKVFHYRVQIQ